MSHKVVRNLVCNEICILFSRVCLLWATTDFVPVFNSFFFLASSSPQTTKTQDLNSINAGMVSNSSVLCFCDQLRLNLKLTLARGGKSIYTFIIISEYQHV